MIRDQGLVCSVELYMLLQAFVLLKVQSLLVKDLQKLLQFEEPFRESNERLGHFSL